MSNPAALAVLHDQQRAAQAAARIEDLDTLGRYLADLIARIEDPVGRTELRDRALKRVSHLRVRLQAGAPSEEVPA